MTSPLAVGFRGFMAGQSPHIIRRQTGCPEGFQRQWGEPVQRHKWEEAGIIDWVLVSGIQGEKIEKCLSCLKVRACAEVLHGGDAAERWDRRGAFARRCRWKVNHSCSVWTVICMLLATASENCAISGQMFRTSSAGGRSSDPFSWPPATTLTPSTPGSKNSSLMRLHSLTAAIWIEQIISYLLVSYPERLQKLQAVPVSASFLCPLLRRWGRFFFQFWQRLEGGEWQAFHPPSFFQCIRKHGRPAGEATNNSTWKHCKCTAQPGCIQRTQQACFRSFIFNYNPTNWDVIYIYIYVYKYLDKNNYIKEKPLSWGCCSPDIAMLARKFSSSDLSLNLLFYGGLLHIETSINIHHDTAFSQW